MNAKYKHRKYPYTRGVPHGEPGDIRVRVSLFQVAGPNWQMPVSALCSCQGTSGQSDICLHNRRRFILPIPLSEFDLTRV
jgi:hypothetical protein